MIFRYGDYFHAANENWFTINARFRHNSLGLPQTIVNQWVIHGSIIQLDADQSSLKEKIAALEAAYGVDGKDVIVYQNDGSTQTHHVLLNENAINGVRVKELTWLHKDPRQPTSGNEHVNKRSYRIVLEAEIVDADASPLVSWQETVIGVGTGGPVNIFKPALVGPPQKQTIQQQSSFRAIQTGVAIGFLGYPAQIATPIWTTEEHVERRRVEPRTPVFGVNFNTLFPITWHYEFESATTQLAANPGSFL